MKEDVDRQVQADEEEERELLRKSEEVRRRREAVAREVEERIEREEREDKERYERITVNGGNISSNLQRSNELEKEDIESSSLTSNFQGLSFLAPQGKERDIVGVEVRKMASQRTKPTKPRPLILPLRGDEPEIIGDTEPDISLLIAEMSSMFQAQSQMIKELSASNLQLQRDMRDVL